MKYYVNGEFISSEDASIPFNDAGFLYGYGLFETMRFENRNIFSIANHLNRLIKGLSIIGIKIDKSKLELENLINKVININNMDSGIVRLMITNGNSEQSKSNITSPRFFISIKPFYEVPTNPVRVIYFKESNYPIIRFTPAIKSMNYIGNMLSKKDCEKQGGYEPVFYNDYNIITECAIRNIFYFKNNVLLTPSLDLGILSGVMRETIIDIAKDLNFEVKESHIDYKVINDMDEAFISSTGIGLLPCYWDGWISTHENTKLIKKELFKRIKNS